MWINLLMIIFAMYRVIYIIISNGFCEIIPPKRI